MGSLLEGIQLPEWVGPAAGICVIFLLSITAFRSWSTFHENEFVRKRMKRLEEAASTGDISDAEMEFLENSKMVERLGMTTKIKCTPNDAKLVHMLYNTGEFPIAVLKPTLPFLTLKNGKVKAHMDRFDTFCAYVSGITALLLIGYGYYLTWDIGTYSGDLSKLIAGTTVFLVYALMSFWVGKAFRTKRKLEWAFKKLKEVDLHYKAPTEGAIAEEAAEHLGMNSGSLGAAQATEPA